MNKILRLIITYGTSLIILISCDPMDDRIVFINNSNDRVIINMMFINDTLLGSTHLGHRDIPSKETQKIGKIGKWDNTFKYYKTVDSSISVFVFQENILGLTSSQEIDSTILTSMKDGDFLVKKYTLETLINQEWQITFPDEGFERGKPIDFLGLKKIK